VENTEEAPPIYYACNGVVIDNADPRGLHRVRIDVIGIMKMSPWALPITSGGGSPQRGGHVVPAIGADVIVWFLYGDRERPVYACAHWGIPSAGSEMPDPAKEANAEAHLVQTLQLGKICFTADERPGKRKLSAEDQVTGDAIVWDLEKQGLRIRMTSAILLEALGLIDIRAAQTSIMRRLVQITKKVI
jgi:hypothetical protein